ncbi:MAG TPA: hypothetical protein VMI31_10910 [Fimbriimonadaceae bacterium]|nr:hypothetical protein [Fimbriimonadaceae bacterium]
MSTLFASFRDVDAAEKAAGALIDQGAMSSQISIIANEVLDTAPAAAARADASSAEDAAKHGISTTTAADAGIGATKGATVGLGLGAAAAIAALFVPGFGLVAGGGALALAVITGAATTVAGTAAGAVVGYLKDQGVPEEVAIRYSSDFTEGRAILALSLPAGNLAAGEAEALLAKYGALNAATYYSAKAPATVEQMQSPKIPLQIDNPDVDPLARSAVVDVTVPTPRATRVIDASTGEETVVSTRVDAVVVDPVSGEPVVATPDPVAETIEIKRDDVELY